MPYTREELIRERREGAVRSIVRAVGYALAQGRPAEDVGRFLYDSYRLGGEFERRAAAHGGGNIPAFVAWHSLARWGWCEDVTVRTEQDSLIVESGTMLQDQADVLGFHGVARMDMEACMEAFWRLSGQEMGLTVTYTIGDEKDWAVIRGGGAVPQAVETPFFTADALAAHRRLALATGITSSIGYAKCAGDEPEEFGDFFFQVWDRSGHYDRLREKWGYGNALAYAQNMARSRQLLYARTEMTEDLDGYSIASPSWASEIPQIMGMFGCLPDDVYRYYEGGGVPACIKLGLQYADQSDDRIHRVWIRSR
jgi:catechol 2,3-dioxygenase-like lactoylglutathione lyase family enzyme